MDDFVKDLVLEQANNNCMTESLKEEIARSFGVTVSQIEEFLAEEGF